jgi:hypothetical protein
MWLDAKCFGEPIFFMSLRRACCFKSLSKCNFVSFGVTFSRLADCRRVLSVDSERYFDAKFEGENPENHTKQTVSRPIRQRRRRSFQRGKYRKCKTQAMRILAGGVFSTAEGWN